MPVERVAEPAAVEEQVLQLALVLGHCGVGVRARRARGARRLGGGRVCVVGVRGG